MLLPVLLTMLGSAGEPAGAQHPRTDVIVIIADDVAFEDVAQHPTPNIDALAARGMSFDRAFANPSCSSSRRSLHFGRWWTESRGEYCKPADEHTPGRLPTFPRLAQSLGYQTALFGKWHVGSNPEGPALTGPRFHGYDTWRAGIGANVNGPVCGGAGSYYRWQRIDDGRVSTSLEYADAAIRDAFLGWWSATRRPRLAVVSFQLAHQPFQVPPAELLPPGTTPATGSRRKFAQMLQALDTLVGQVLSVAGPEDIIFFIGDNGTPQSVAPDPVRAKGTTLERGIHVPLIVRAPFVRGGQVSSSLVHIADIFPTLADLVRKPLDNGQGAFAFVVDPCDHRVGLERAARRDRLM
jgi:arylsulfatase A